MSITMYAASVPVFRRYLEQLSTMVTLAARHAKSQGIDPDALLQARLAPSMYPFVTQVEIAANFVLRACAPLAGREIPPYGEFDASFTELEQRIRNAQAFLGTLTSAQMAGSESREITSQAGLATSKLHGQRFRFEYALPNFLCHVTTAYAILRNAGVALGKSDFDGFHAYASQYEDAPEPATITKPQAISTS